jgi:type IV secretory pathway VirB2 component (pilin)
MTTSRSSVKPILMARPSRRCLLAVAMPAHAAGSSMPWEGPLESILESIQGPVARIVAVIVIIATGLALAFGDTSWRLPQADPDRVRPVDRVRGFELLPVVLLVQSGGAVLA